MDNVLQSPAFIVSKYNHQDTMMNTLIKTQRVSMDANKEEFSQSKQDTDAM